MPLNDKQRSMVAANLDLVPLAARRYRHSALGEDDLRGVGFLVLAIAAARCRDLANFRAYAYTAIHRRMMTESRRASRHRARFVPMGEPDGCADHRAQTRRSGLFDAALSTAALSTRERMLLALVYRHGFTHADAAGAVGCPSAKAARNAMTRAMRKLRRNPELRKFR